MSVHFQSWNCLLTIILVKLVILVILVAFHFSSLFDTDENIVSQRRLASVWIDFNQITGSLPATIVENFPVYLLFYSVKLFVGFDVIKVFKLFQVPQWSMWINCVTVKKKTTLMETLYHKSIFIKRWYLSIF